MYDLFKKLYQDPVLFIVNSHLLFMRSHQLKEKIQRGVKQFDSIMEQLYRQQKFHHSFSDTWRVQDVLAHILWYEEQMVILLEETSLHRSSPHWNNDFDTRNALIFDDMKGLTPDELWSRHTIALITIYDLLDLLDDSYLDDSSKFDGMPEEWIPWQIIAQNTYQHYEDHLERLENLL